MKINHLQNKTLYITPYNDLAIKLRTFLQKHIEFNFLGYIDKTEHNLVSPNYYDDITEVLLQNKILINKILYISNKKHSFKIHKSKVGYKFSSNLSLNLFTPYRLIDYIKILLLKNKHKDKRAFILGNGPSLNTEDLEKIKNEISFAANKIYLSFDSTMFRPNYYFITDSLVYSQNYNTINKLSLNKYFSNTMLLNEKRLKNATYFPLNYKFPSYFGINPFKNMYSGSTVVFVMLEFAVYMGIKEIYIIGLDFSFTLPSNANTKELICEGETNHFHKDYRKVGEKWTKPNMERQKEAFIQVQAFCDKHNIKIFNASRSTKLDVFETINFDSLFST